MIKSKQRVKDYGEVYTSEREVKAMCDLIPQDVWEKIESTFLEPTCGNGAFLKEIFARKLAYCKDERDGLKALNSIFGIDILEDNVNESRELLLIMFLDRFPNASKFSVAMAIMILRKRIICGDSLKIMQEWEQEDNKQAGDQIQWNINRLKQSNMPTRKNG